MAESAFDWFTLLAKRPRIQLVLFFNFKKRLWQVLKLWAFKKYGLFYEHVQAERIKNMLRTLCGKANKSRATLHYVRVLCDTVFILRGLRKIFFQLNLIIYPKDIRPSLIDL